MKESQHKPLFSIITVTWNAASVIVPTLESVSRQTWTNYEYLVIDGASTDATLDLARESRIATMRLFSEPDKGLYDAMNKGIHRAQGDYLIFLNAGDAFASDTVLARLAELCAARPGVVYGQTQLVDATRTVVGQRHLTAPKHLDAQSFKHGMLVCHQAFVARRDLVPDYDLSYRFSADYDWCIKVLQKSTANAYAGDEPIISFLTDGLTDKHHSESLKERYKIMCHYYGTLPTMLRHIGFLARHIMRRLRTKR